MKKIINRNLEIRREELCLDEVRRRCEGEPYKLSILDGIESSFKTSPPPPITIYHIGDEWWDVCEGPHVPSTGDICLDGFKLMSVSGSSWGGSQTNSLQRIR